MSVLLETKVSVMGRIVTVKIETENASDANLFSAWLHAVSGSVNEAKARASAAMKTAQKRRVSAKGKAK